MTRILLNARCPVKNKTGHFVWAPGVKPFVVADITFANYW